MLCAFQFVLNGINNKTENFEKCIVDLNTIQQFIIDINLKAKISNFI